MKGSRARSPALPQRARLGGYVVDEHAVAEAMLRRIRMAVSGQDLLSPVRVAGQRERAAIRSEQLNSAARHKVA